MTTGQGVTPAPTAGGGGKLAQVIATRGGLAPPEAPFVIEHREALIYMLCEAAELEHGIMCQYLFAAFSLKQSAEEGLTGPELEAVLRWRKQIAQVAAQEMLHLALVHNLLSAIGAAPHLARPNLPAPASHYPAGVRLALLPFGEQALRHFMFLERPEGMDIEDAEGLAAAGRAAPVLDDGDIVPQGQDFSTVGHLYRSIEAGLHHLAELHGEDWLFVGPPRAQATAGQFGWPELIPVRDLASACRAIEEILEQGEGPRGQWREAHFGQFVNILDEYLELREANPRFDPVRPVVVANVRPSGRDTGVALIEDGLTARVTDLFNVGYEILLQIFERFFAHTEETDAQLQVLADAATGLMLNVIRPLGDLITTLPAGSSQPGKTAGPSFELFYESDYLMPHKEAAWALLAERLSEAARLCDRLRADQGERIASRLAPVLTSLRTLSRGLAVHLPPGSPHAALAAAVLPLDRAELGALAGRARDIAASVPDGQGGELMALFEGSLAIVNAAAGGPGCEPTEQAVIVPRMVSSVLRPLADALRRAPPHAGPAAGDGPRPGSDAAAGVTGRPGSAAERVWAAAQAATLLRTRLGKAGTCPAELAEATAALQDLACRLAPPDTAAVRRARLRELQHELPAAIQAMGNGPYLVTNVPRLADHLGTQLELPPQLALCRCGASAMKPWCDGSHAAVGFSDEKDPKRVPDCRDSYQGQELTIFDNRGICQHSGLCTDRLAAVFRIRGEPYVAASGARMDEIIRTVRDCPSGALSYAIDGIEAREQVDWGGTREPAIEVTRDGPYRITGEIPLLGADGSPQPRARGASAEHYALCRCGKSQNKPFCSGMHWYVGFTDPAPPAEPTLFEWAGGQPALLRMCRLLHEKHIPADPLLAPLFAGTPPGQPRLLAGWLAAALGGPAAAGQAGDPREATGFGSGGASEEQRARWTALVAAAADDARLPADPGFRSALAACTDWLSRAATANGQPATAGSAVPQWDWGPGGPPAPAQAAPDDEPDGAAQPAMPGPGEPVGFDAHIRPLFRPRDRQSMSFAFDLLSCDTVREHAGDILTRLRDGSMPCDGAWTAERVEVFQRWIDAGMPG